MIADAAGCWVFVTHVGATFISQREVENWQQLSRKERDMAYELMVNVIADEIDSQ